MEIPNISDIIREVRKFVKESPKSFWGVVFVVLLVLFGYYYTDEKVNLLPLKKKEEQQSFKSRIKSHIELSKKKISEELDDLDKQEITEQIQKRQNYLEYQSGVLSDIDESLQTDNIDSTNLKLLFQTIKLPLK